jgi:hypothetical protein
MAPVARITGSCTNLSCPLSGGTSTDSDGMILTYAWDWGDGTTSTGVAPGHTYTAADTYTVSLTVTDDDGAENTATTSVTVNEAPPGSIAFRAAGSSDSNSTAPAVVVPASVQPGDRLVMFVSTNTSATQTTPAGWTLVDTVSDGTDIRSQVFTRAAVTGTAGSTVRVTLSVLSKTSMVVVAYSGASGVSASASAAENGSAPTSHTAPNVTVGTAASTVLRYWVDKTSTVHGWTLPVSLTQRATTVGSGGGLLAAVLGDAAGVPAGSAGTAVATAAVGSGKAVMWSVVVAP